MYHLYTVSCGYACFGPVPFFTGLLLLILHDTSTAPLYHIQRSIALGNSPRDRPHNQVYPFAESKLRWNINGKIEAECADR